MSVEQDAPVVRVTTLRAKPGHGVALIDAARGNASDAVAADGCRSAEVCRDPDSADTLLVISRWSSGSALREFLRWHEGTAHASLAASLSGPPTSVHYPVLPTR